LSEYSSREQLNILYQLGPKGIPINPALKKRDNHNIRQKTDNSQPFAIFTKYKHSKEQIHNKN